MILKSSRSGSSYIFAPQEENLRAVLSGLTMVKSINIIEDGIYQELQIEISDSYLQTPSEIFNLGGLVEALLK